jgi:hypothetical protein
MTYDDAVAAATAVTDQFLATFNNGDAQGHTGTLAFPHVRLASGHVRIWTSRDVAVAAVEQGILALRKGSGWHHSEWDHRRVIHARADKVHLDVQFTRYRDDGSVIGAYPAVYVVVNQAGTWLIQCRSSFAP